MTGDRREPVSRRGPWIGRLDRLVIGATALLSAMSVWIGSSPVPRMWDYRFVLMFWAVVGTMWVVSLVLQLRRRPPGLVWLVAPVIVVASAGLVVSGVARSVRFAVAEPTLTQYVQGLGQDSELPGYDAPIDVGGIPVHEVIRQSHQVLLVTNFIGILGDDGAGLAYSPDGPPVDVGEWEPLGGAWYAWSPY